jgi:aspartate 1-decarboxylase
MLTCTRTSRQFFGCAPKMLVILKFLTIPGLRRVVIILAPSHPGRLVMQRTLLKSKLHRVHTTASELNYEGSCAIDELLLEAADIREYEQIDIYNVNNGERFTTYAIKGQRGSGMISVNGAAARKAAVGDILIIATFASYTELELAKYEPKLVYVDDKNRVKRVGSEIPAQAA